MSTPLSPSDIRPAVEAVLRSASNGLSSYQILDRLPGNLRDQVIAERGLPGAGSGNSYSAASLVTDAVEGLLPSLEPPFRVYIDTGSTTLQVAGHTVTPGNPAIAFYRLPVGSGTRPTSDAPSPPQAVSSLPPTANTKTVASRKQEWFEQPGTLALAMLFWPVFLLGMYYNGRRAIEEGRTPWYEKTELLVVSLLFFPLFLMGVFSSRRISPRGKWVTAGAFAALCVWSVAVPPKENPATAEASPAPPAPAAVATAAPPVAPPPPARRDEQGVYVTKGNSLPFAINRDDLDRAVRYGVEKDYDALQQMIDSGRVGMWKPGIRVRIVAHRGLLADTIKVRPVGSTDEFWTLNEAVDKQ